MSDLVAAKQEKIQELIEDLASELNCMGIDEKELGEIISTTVMKDHRTIQQTFWRTIQHSIVHYGRYATIDLRNEGSREWANKVAEVDAYFPKV